MSDERSPWWARALALNALSDPRFVPLAIALLFTAIAARAVLEPFGDQDAGWLAATGRQLLASHEIPHTNGWSISDADVPWVVHEWALTPIYAVLMASWGLAGPVCLGLCAAAISTMLLVHATIGRARRLATGALACVVAMALTRECLVEPRPAYVVLGAPIAMAVMALAPTLSIGRAAACVALELAWANVHGSFPIGLALLTLGALTYPSDRGRRAVTLVLASLASLATPYGMDLFGLVARYVASGDDTARAIHAHIAEFQPLWAAGPVFGGPVRIVGVAIVVVIGVMGARRGDRETRMRSIGAIAIGVLAIVHSRHVPQAVMLGAVLLVPAIDNLLERVPLEQRAFDGPRVARSSSVLVTVAASIAIGVTCTRGVHADAALGGDALPSLARDPRVASAHVYVAFDASGRFLWLAPDARVLFDPRNDCYRGETARAAYAIEEGDCTGPCLDAALARYDVDAALVPDGHASLDTLRASDRFDEVRTLDAWHLFVVRR